MSAGRQDGAVGLGSTGDCLREPLKSVLSRQILRLALDLYYHLLVSKNQIRSHGTQVSTGYQLTCARHVCSRFRARMTNLNG